jgi:hypothetical protein
VAKNRSRIALKTSRQLVEAWARYVEGASNVVKIARSA